MDLKLLVLDRLRNVITSTREVEEMLVAQAKGKTSKLLKDRYSIQAARTLLREHLTKWITDNGFTGHGSSKLVGKAMSRGLVKYEPRLRAALMDDIRRAKQAGRGWRYLQAEFDAGRIGKNIK